MLPPSFDEAKLEALAGASGEAVVDAVVDSIVKAAPVVDKGQELSIGTTDLAKADGIVLQVQGELVGDRARDCRAKRGGPRRFARVIARSIKDYASAAPASVPKPESLGAGSKSLFEKAATLHVMESLPEPPKELSAAPISPMPLSAPKPSALYGTAKVSELGLVSGLVAADRTFFAADAKGEVSAFTADGSVVWSAKTRNSENDNSCPVLGTGLIAFAGDKELSVFDASSGKQLFSRALDSSDSGLFGRRPAIAGNKLYLATSDGIVVLDAQSGSSVGTIALHDDVEMTPAVSGTKLYAASVGGVFYVMDGEGLSVSGQVTTPATQPYAAAPLVSGGYAYFVDRKGLAVCIDLGAQTVAWSKRVDAGKNLNVLQDPVVGDSGLYVFAKSTIYGLSSRTGERLFEPIGGASSPPAIVGGALWFGTQDNRIVAADPLTGKTRATLPVPARVVGAAVESGDLLAFPTESGQVFFVNPATMLSE